MLSMCWIIQVIKHTAVKQLQHKIAQNRAIIRGLEQKNRAVKKSPQIHSKKCCMCEWGHWNNIGAIQCDIVIITSKMQAICVYRDEFATSKMQQICVVCVIALLTHTTAKICVNSLCHSNAKKYALCPNYSTCNYRRTVAKYIIHMKLLSSMIQPESLYMDDRGWWQ